MKIRILRWVMYGALLIALMSSVYGVGVASGRKQSEREIQESSAIERPMIDYVNDVRKANNVGPLTEDPLLVESAKIKAEDLDKRNYFTHDTPTGEPFYNVILKTRPGSRLIGENLGKCYNSNKQMMDGWIGSEKHLANIVKAEYTKYGSYTLWDADQHCFIVVNHFGR